MRSRFGGVAFRRAFADASQSKQLAKLFRGHAVVINCTQHDFNLKVMRAALAAKVHYVDLGGLFHWTRRQLKLKQAIQARGVDGGSRRRLRSRDHQCDDARSC